MDKQLAEMYGTLNDESDTEKVAAAQLAAALTPEEEEGEVKVAELTDEQVEQLAEVVLAHIMGGSEEPEEKNEAKVEAKEEEEAKVEEPAKEEEKAEEKEEAKVEEPAEKQAAAEEEEAREKLAEADFLGRVMAHAFTNELKLIKQASVEEQPVEKKASAFDTLAQQRAAEILHANGINPETLTPYEQQEEEVTEEPEKQAASEEELAALDSKVTERAMSLLTELGFEFETEQK